MAQEPRPLPPILQGLLTAPQTVQMPQMQPGQGLAGASMTPPMQGAPMGQGMPRQYSASMDMRQLPSFEVGGAVGPGGMPIRPAGLQPGTEQGPMDPQMVEMQVQQFAAQNPQAVAEIKQAINDALMSGELTPQELNMLVQMATTVMRSPEMYPQMRQFAIQQGLATEQDLPPQYDQGLVIAILIAAQAAQSGMGGQNMMAGGTPAMAGGMPIQSLKDGGRVQGADSTPVVIEAHTGEYVIPKHVVDMKGREFFDRMLEQYKDKAS